MLSTLGHSTTISGHFEYRRTHIHTSTAHSTYSRKCYNKVYQSRQVPGPRNAWREVGSLRRPGGDSRPYRADQTHRKYHRRVVVGEGPERGHHHRPHCTCRGWCVDVACGIHGLTRSPLMDHGDRTEPRLSPASFASQLSQSSGNHPVGYNITCS